jgi:hypothetical protein
MNFHKSISPFKLIKNEMILRDYPSICLVKLNLNNNNEFNMIYLVRQMISVLLLCLKSQGKPLVSNR